MVSEAEFAVSVKEWPRAEGLYTSATTLCPDDPDIWVKLGVARMRLGNHSGARDAFKSGAAAYKDAIKANPANTQLVVRLAYVYVVLGRPDEARDLVAKARTPRTILKTPFSARSSVRTASTNFWRIRD